MIESLNGAWAALERGNLNQAEKIFEQHLDDGPHGGEVYRGLMRVAADRGNLQQAEKLGERALQIDDSAINMTSLADILGRQGKRVEAENLLERAVDIDASDSYTLALLGEQRIRQGRWDEGTQNYIDALSSDSEGHAFKQFRVVVADMVDAVNQGRIPKDRAEKFVNQVDYSVPKSGPGMQSFFGQVRRAILSGRSMNLDGSRSRDQHRHGARGGSSSAAPSARGGQQGAASTPPARPPTRGSQASRPSRNEPTPQPDRSQTRGTERSGGGRRNSGVGVNIDPNQKDLVAVIQNDRLKNRELLSDLPDMPPPDWPSQAGYDSIDDVPAISMQTGAIFGKSAGIDTRDFSVTSGDILTEIFLERCLRNLLVATQENKATTIQLRPESFLQMELNCRDGLLQKMRPLSPIYDDRKGFENFRRLAVGMFVGECLVRAFDGTWSFEVTPADSYLEVGAVILEPFELVERWMSAEDKDSVFLDEIVRRAQRASHESTSMTVRQDYIDPTKELSDKALVSKLAVVWSNYLFSITDASFAEIAQTLELLEVDDEVIIFALAPTWAPEYAMGPKRSGTGKNGKVALAYLRDTGQFLPLASRKSVARLLETTLEELDYDTASDVLDIVARYHRPAWSFVRTEEDAQALSQRVGRDVSTPRLGENGGTKELRFWAVVQKQVVAFVVTHDPSRLIPWRVRTRRA